MMYSERHLPDIEQWLQRHPEAGSSWPSWPKASQPVSPEAGRYRAVFEFEMVVRDSVLYKFRFRALRFRALPIRFRALKIRVCATTDHSENS